MRIAAVVGNPPYQKNLQDTSDEQIYPEFMELGYALSCLACFVTPGRFLFNAGKTNKEWNKKMLSDPSFSVSLYEPSASKIFPSMGFKGGIAISLRNRDDPQQPIGVFTPVGQLRSVIDKVRSHDGFISLSLAIYPPESYKFSSTFHDEMPQAKLRLSKGHAFDIVTNIFERLDDVFVAEKPEDGEKWLKFFGRYRQKRTCRWVVERYIQKHPNLYKYKVVVPKSNGSGAFGEVLSAPFVADPFTGTTQTFMTFGAFDAHKEADAALAYLKTKFARAMLGTLKVTQDNKASTWANVPLQDFTPRSDIDWTRSVTEIDHQLYEKYGLNLSEIEFIEHNVVPMS